jgi:uncharacterized membrane protein YuzA (DUF378 family)
MMKKGWCVPHKLSWLLVVIGGINWGLVGAFEWNLVNALLGAWPIIERIVYVLVGLAALVMLVGCKCKKCRAADMGGKKGMMEEKKEM